MKPDAKSIYPLVPMILRERGYRIGLFSSEPGESVHVHVAKGGNEAKFLIPIWNEHRLRKICVKSALNPWLKLPA
jgi:hypothetical protein